MRRFFTTVLEPIERLAGENKLGIFLGTLLLLITIIVVWPFVVVKINSGEGGVLFHRFSGIQMDRVYEEGLYAIWPWNTMFVYNLRVQTERHEIEILTKNGLRVKLRVVVRFQPDHRALTKLHKQVGPDFIQRVVLPETIAVLRNFLGRYDAEEIITTKRGLLDRIVLNALEASEQRYVVIDDVLIEAITLPDIIRASIEEKLVYQQRQLAYQFRIELEKQEARRKAIEATGIDRYNETVQRNLSDQLIRWQGVQATKELALSPNAKTVIIGAGENGLPVILGNDGPAPPSRGESMPRATDEAAAMRPSASPGSALPMFPTDGSAPTGGQSETTRPSETPPAAPLPGRVDAHPYSGGTMPNGAASAPPLPGQRIDGGPRP